MTRIILTTLIFLTLSLFSFSQPNSIFLRGKTYNLSWYDEFNGARVDSTRWDFRSDSKNLSTQLRKNNVLENGILRQFLRKETVNGKSYTAGGLISKDSLQYGYYETMIKTPPKKGWHSAFWLMKHDGTGGTGVAKATLEIDVLENESENLNSFTCLHKKYNPIQNLGTKTFNTSQLSTKFIKVACLYEPDSITFYYDNKQVDKRYIGNLISGKVNIWLTSIGYTGPITETVLPSTFEVDYIRFYQQSPPAQTASTLFPTADAMVQNGSGASTNFGTLPQLGTQLSNSLNTKESLLRFDLSTVQNYIGSAKLRIYGGANTASGTSPVGKVTALDPNNNWTETGVTWNTKPTESGSVLTSTSIVGTSQKYYDFDITPYLINQKEVAMRNIVNLKISQNAGTEALADFLSREAGSNPPQLVIKPLQLVPGIEEQLKDTIWMKDSVLAFTPKIRILRTTNYQWKKNGVVIPGATSATLNFASLQPSDAGQYSLRMSYGIGFDTVETRQATITVQTSNQKPTAILSFPTVSTTYAMGETLNLVGSGTDPETGALKNPDIRWVSRYYRNGTIVSTTQLGSGFNLAYKVPTTTEASNNVYYRIYLIARDPQGGRDTVWRDISPRIRNVNVTTSPSGLQVIVNGVTQISPISQSLIEGSVLPLDVPDPQGSLVFQNWSQGGIQKQSYTIPGSNPTLIANLVTGTVLAINPSADAYVVGSSVINYGSATTLIVKNSTSSSSYRESYLRFPISSITGSLNNARLRLYGALSDFTDPVLTIQVKEINSASIWEESTLTWSNKPTVLTPILAFQDITGTTPAYYEWDLTSFVQSKIALGNANINIQISSPYETATRVDFNSKEAGSNMPQLRLALLLPIITSSPINQSKCEGESVTFSSTASGSPGSTVQWQVSTNSGSSWENIPLANNPNLTFNTIISDNGKQYKAVWTNTVGSVSSNPASLIVNPIPTPTISSPVNSICQGGSVVLTSSSPTGNVWSTGETTQTISVSTGGTFSVSVTANGCVGISSQKVISVNPNPMVYSITGGGSYCSVPGTGTSVNLSGSQIGVNYEFKFTAGGTPAILAGTGSSLIANNIIGFGTIYVVATFGTSGCSATMNGSASVSIQTATTWYRDVDGDGFGTSLTSTQSCTQPAGYVSIGTDCNDNNAMVNPSKTDFCGNGIDDNCNGQTDENCALYTFYRDSDSDGFGNLSVFISSNNSTVPIGYVTNSTDCNDGNSAINPGSIEICNGLDDNCDGSIDNNLTPLNSPTSISGPDGVCRSSSGQIFTTPAIPGATSYIWTLPTGATGTSTTNSITLSFSSTYVTDNLCVRPENACQQGTSYCRSVVYYSAKPSTPGTISGLAAGVCSAQNQVYSIDAVANSTSYAWTAPANATIIGGQGTTTVTVKFLAGFVSGNLSVTASNCLGASTAKTMTLSSSTSTPLSVAGSLNTVCAGSIQTYSTPLVAGVTNYLWTVPTGAIINTGQGTNSISVTFPTPFTSGAVTVKSGTACFTSAAKSITVQSVPTAPSSISGPTIGVCAGSTQTYVCPLSTTGATGYNWTVPAGTVINSGQGSNTINVTMSSSFVSGTIGVNATNTCGSSTLRSISVGSAPATPGTISPSLATVCGGGNITYSIAAVAGATGYSWTVPSNCSIVQNNGTNIQVSVPADFVSGSVTVLASNACGNSALKTLALATKPATPGTISGTSANLCGGGTFTYSIAAVSGATIYNWTAPSGCSIVTNNGTNVIMSIPSNFLNGTLSVTAGNACGTSTARTLTPSGIPNLPATISGVSSVCPSAAGIVFNTTSVSGLTYNWTLPNGGTVTSGQGTQAITAKWGSVAGNVSVVAVNACGNSSARTKAISLLPCRLGIIEDETNNELTENDSNILVYPNPGSGIFHLEFPSGISQGVLQIYNMQGVMVDQKAIDSSLPKHTLDLKDQPSGVYQLLFRSQKRQMNLKIVKE